MQFARRIGWLPALTLTFSNAVEIRFARWENAVESPPRGGSLRQPSRAAATPSLVEGFAARATSASSPSAFLSANAGLEVRKELQKMNAGKKGKEIILAMESRKHLLQGINTVADTIKVTLGPMGRNILVESQYGPPLIVNDGVTIARNIELPDRRQNAGAKLIQEVASTSDDRAGDGTTSTTILTAKIANTGVENLSRGQNPIPLQKGIQAAAKVLMNQVRSLAKPVTTYDDILNIATVATSGNAVMGGVIAQAFDKLGPNAATIIEENPAIEDTVEFTEGYTFERGFASPHFLLGEEKDIIEWQNARVLVCDYKLESMNALVPLLESFVKSKEPLVLLADDFGQEVMQILFLNKIKGSIKAVACKAPSFGERRKDFLRDIAIATGAEVFSKEVGLNIEDATLSHLGSVRTAVIRKERTSLVTHPHTKPAIEARIKQIQRELDQATTKFDREKLSERISALSGGVARILIGAATETEHKEKRYRYEDAINACRAAMETGYVPGGGVTYIELAKEATANKVFDYIRQNSQVKSDDHAEAIETQDSDVNLQIAGAKIVLDSLDSITKQIAENAGVSGQQVVDKIKSANQPFGYGWDAKTNQFCNLYQRGIIDPAKVIICALENSTSVAGLILTTEGMMIDKEDDKHRDEEDL